MSTHIQIDDVIIRVGQVPHPDRAVERGREDNVLGQGVELDDGDLVPVGGEHGVGLVLGLEEAAFGDVPHLMKEG